jgi:hypothetical protein
MPKHWICLNLSFNAVPADSPAQSTAVSSLVVATSIRFAVIIRYLGGLSFTAVTASAVQGHYPVLRERRLPPSGTVAKLFTGNMTKMRQVANDFGRHTLKWLITVFQRNLISINNLTYCTNFKQRLKRPRLSSVRLTLPRVFNKVIHRFGG